MHRRLEGPAATGAEPGDPKRSDRVVRVVATTSVVGDMVRAVGGVNVGVHVAVKAGLSPLAYQPTPADVEATRAAELVLAVGRGLEPWLDALRTAAASTATVVVLDRGVPERMSASGRPDPFLWHDPRHASAMVATLAEALAAVDPADAAAFDLAADRYRARIADAGVEADRVLAAARGKRIVTAGDSMGWLAARSGFEVAGSLDRATTPADLAALKAIITARGVRAMFGEAGLPPAPIQQLAKETGTTAVVGDDALFAYGLGPAGSDGDTYLGALAHNARVIAAHA